MPSVLICAPGPLLDDLQETLLGRDDVDRRAVTRATDAVAAMLMAKPDLVVIDARLAEAEALINGIRSNPVTRPVSIVVVAGGEFSPAEVRFIDAGANAILRLPAGPEWDDRLNALLYVPTRRAGRLPALVQFEATAGVESIAGTVLNLSEHGMLVETDVPLPMGADVDFKIHLRDTATPLIGCGQIVRQESERRSGVRFYGLESDGLARVKRFVKAGG
jgi:DNA-binding response OmpR family regulator